MSQVPLMKAKTSRGRLGFFPCDSTASSN